MASNQAKLSLWLRKLSNVIIFSCILTKTSIIEPANKKENLKEIGIVFVQGALIKSTNYVKLCEKIQEDNKELKIWISITNAFFNIPISYFGSIAIDASLRELYSQGLSANAQIYLIGHSLGGKAAIDYCLANQENKNIKGLIMLGSIPERTIRSDTQNMNILVIGGELDGLSRVTRLTEEFYHRNLDTSKKNFKVFEFKNNDTNEFKFLEYKNQKTAAILQQSSRSQNNSTSTAVVVLEGLNHMSFASGEPTWFVAQRDLKAEVSETSAHKSISELISFFFNKNTNAINNRIKETNTLIKPIIEAFEMEGSIYFNRPHQSECHRGYCSIGSDWTIEAQKILSMESLLQANNVTLNVTNDYVVLSSLPPFGDLFHPKRNMQNNILGISTYSQCSWALVNRIVDAGFAPISADEIGSKMLSFGMGLQ